MAMMVSVYCLAYNHGKYIKDALEGFVNQVTDFEYEVFVHDDASTDNTVELILEYARKYPDIIKPIIQTENKYSQGISIFYNYIFPKMSGKYIAACEGDDYWCERDKLQKQIDFLENNEDYVACAHDSIVLDYRKDDRILFSSRRKSGQISMREIVDWKCIFQSASLVYRRRMRDIPQLRSINGMGDYSFALQMRDCGKIYYMKEPMSVYRVNVEGSWSMRNSDRNRNACTMIEILEEFDSLSAGKYRRLIQRKEDELNIGIYYRENDLEQLKKMGSVRIAHSGNIKLAVSIFMQSHCRWLFLKLRKIIRKV